MALRFLTAGESHGPRLTAILDGLPAGLAIDASRINADLARRQLGVGRGGRMAIESDQIAITGGVRFGETIGGPVSLSLENRDWQSWKDRMQIEPLGTDQVRPDAVSLVRPGHIDLAGTLKLDRNDVRDSLERASARETAMRVAVGAICRALLALFDIHVSSRLLQYGALHFHTPEATVYHSLLPTQRDWELHQEQLLEEGASAIAHFHERMATEVVHARTAGTTLGGSFQVIGWNCPVGLGHFGQWDRRLDGRIAQGLMSIPTVKAVCIGAGTDLAGITGQESNDPLYVRTDAERVAGSPWWLRRTNHMGGIEGGLTNGEPVIASCHLKPISTQTSPLPSIDLITRQSADALLERSDTAVVEAAAVVGEAMLGFVLVETLLEQFGNGSLGDLTRAVAHYRKRTAAGRGASGSDQ